MSLSALLTELATRGISLSAEGGSLAVSGPPGALTPELREVLRTEKAALLAYLAEKAPLPALVPDPAGRFDPFPMSELQEAYCVGRDERLGLSSAMHAYIELHCPDLDLPRLTAAWNTLQRRHDMLRAVALPDFHQQVLTEVPDYEIREEDLRWSSPEAIEARFAAVRGRMRDQVHPIDRWPAFELRACRVDDRHTRLFVSIDGTFIDGYSFRFSTANGWRTTSVPTPGSRPRRSRFPSATMHARRARSVRRHATAPRWTGGANACGRCRPRPICRSNVIRRLSPASVRPACSHESTRASGN